MIVVPMKVAVSRTQIPMSVETNTIVFPVSLTTEFRTIDADPYDGSYTFTPTQETQVVLTSDKLLLDNITINPIPNNYGLITYNGSSIMVS